MGDEQGKEETPDEIKVVDLREFILSHDALSIAPERGKSHEDNMFWFEHDLRSGHLKQYTGTFVAYQIGILCGQSRDGEKLYDQAHAYYGSSNLAVFPVPENLDGLAKAIENGKGWFKKGQTRRS